MDVLALLANLEDTKLDYVVARSKTTTDKAAYEEAGISRSAFYSWGAEERERLNGIAQQLKRENATKAVLKLQEAAEDAVDTIIKLMEKARSENVKFSAATDILDRTIGKPSQKVEQENTNINMTWREFVERSVDDNEG